MSPRSAADRVSPPSVGEHLGTLIRGAELQIFPEGDHSFAHDRADVVAPIIDHYLLCAQLRSEPGQPEVIFLAQSAHDYDSTRARAAGAAGMLDKPLAEHQVQSVLRKYMRL